MDGAVQSMVDAGDGDAMRGSDASTATDSGDAGMVSLGCDGKPNYTILALGAPTGGGVCANNNCGRVRDNTTGLTWFRYQNYVPGMSTSTGAAMICNSMGMRLPTLKEVLGISSLNPLDSGAGLDRCAWPYGWNTFTSDGKECSDSGNYAGAGNEESDFMCVQ
jgi:hypothetical protein